MRILLIGDVSGNLDEGMKKTTSSLYQGLVDENEVVVIHPRQVFKWSTVRQVREIRPEIVHYVHGPSIRSYVIAKWFAAWAGGAKVIITALHPSFSRVNRLLIPLLLPDLVFVQSEKAEKYFQRAGCETKLLPNGADLDRFRPVSAARKKELRTEYGIAGDDFLVLHVGPLKTSRNLGMLAEVQKKLDVRVIIAGSLTEQAEAGVVEYLRSAGCIVWLEYFPQVEHLFQLADCYAFPVVDEMGCVQVPLAVVEAAACNIPIVTTRFGGIDLFMPEGNGLYYVVDQSEMEQAIRACMRIDGVETRKMVEGFSWKAISNQVLEAYKGVTNKDKTS